MCRRYAGPLTGTPLPTTGAPGDQPAALMDAFAMLDRIVAEEKPDGGS
ncbi:hypothetical protein [Sphingomonas morindae]|uniref:Uncharacterized protein n=1 Tax=Sphingomonas morindae TaxID=1541170 RepID=A0ABY4X433_9SPHN|nr:hypothetical protein [Sphingomonas morindae]USI71615.1 hypothetical protein LHA26_09725 [Sphingomonas morindae]